MEHPAPREGPHGHGQPIDYATADYPADARSALAMLDASYTHWVKGVGELDAHALLEPIGPSEGTFAAYPYAALVLHINREAIHHLAEVTLLRDLYRAQH